MTKIEWGHIPGFKGESWNPLTGCTPISPGCDNCYAKRLIQRLPNLHGFDVWENEGGPSPFWRIETHPERLRQPLKWSKPRSIFVCSLSDLFHSGAGSFIHAVFAVMAQSPQHLFMLLTKRPKNAQKYLTDPETPERIDNAAVELGMCHANLLDRWPLPNVWLGVTAENQEMADSRIPILLETPAARRFVSVEPMLGQVDLFAACFNDSKVSDMNVRFGRNHEGLRFGVDWVICGGESGPGARPMHPDWAASVRDQCQAASVPFFFKQWGEWAPNCLCESPMPCRQTPSPAPGLPGCMFRCGKHKAGRKLGGREWNQFPSIDMQQALAGRKG